MFPRTYIIVRTICQQATKFRNDKTVLPVDIAIRQFSLLHIDKNVLQKIQIKITARTLVWSQVLAKNSSGPTEKKPDDLEGSKAEKSVVLDNVKEKILHKEVEPKENVEKPESVPVLKVISPKVSEVPTDKTPTEKGKETLVEKAKNTILKTEPIKKLKETIIGKDEKEEKQPIIKVLPKKRKRVDLSAHTVERNFITPNRAMSDFLLRPSDLESLPKTKRRSPYETEPPITVYWRKDVEAKSLEIWGSKEKLQRELIKRDIERKKYQQNLFTVKRRLRDYRREMSSGDVLSNKEGLLGRSGKVVLTAVAINATNCLFKFFAWLYTGSHSMFSEFVHSLADTINQLILAFGIHKSIQTPDSYHPYGYSNMKYVASLISGVGIFCVGTGLSVYHGVSGLFHPEPIEDFYWAYFILAGSLVSEGATWLVALNSIRRGAKIVNMSVKDYIFRGQDPSVNVVLLEDFAAVVGVIVAGGCMGISSLTNSPIPDALGSLLVGCILGSVASFIIYTNVAALVGRSIPEENLEKINQELESDVMIRAIHDVKGIDMGSYLVRYKAELDFDGRELTKAYLDKQDLNELLEDIRKLENIDKLEEFMLKHGENIVDMMGGEIDRIELKLREKHPEIRHCDLEIL